MNKLSTRSLLLPQKIRKRLPYGEHGTVEKDVEGSLTLRTALE